MKRLCSLLASVALVVGCNSSANKATGDREVEPVTLTLANWERGDADVGEWARAVERLSKGSMRIEIRGDWRRGHVDTDRATLRDVRAGRVDIGHIAARAWDTLGVNGLRALDAPLLVDSLDLEERVLTSDLGAAMMADVRTAGVEPVALMPGPLMRPVGVSTDLLGPDDFRDRVIGLRPSAVHEATMRALGAKPMHMMSAGSLTPWDGTDADIAAMDFEGYDAQARSMTANVVLWPRPTTLVMNRDTWDDLTRGQRAVIEAAGDAVVAPAMRRERYFERGGTRSLCGSSFPLPLASDAELAALRRAVQPVYRELESDGDTRAAIEEIRSLKQEARAPEELRCDSAKDRGSSAVTEPVVGTWHVNATREKLAAAGEKIGDLDGNWGQITLLLEKNGHFEMRNARFPGQITGFGSWSARGDILTFIPGGDITQGAGETWRYRWTLFRNSLVLQSLTQPAGPLVLTVAPLRRR